MTKPATEKTSEKIILSFPELCRQDDTHCRNLLEHHTSYNSYEPDVESIVFNPPQFFYMKRILVFVVSITVVFAGFLAGYAAYRMHVATNYRALWVVPYETVGVLPRNEDLDWLQKCIKKNVNLPIYDDLFFHEEAEMDLSDDESYTRVNVPEFEDGRPGRFIHDFKENQTAIIDPVANQCFVMPLDHETVLPPKSFSDLIDKLGSGYYNVTTDRIRRTMRVVTPLSLESSDISERITQECRGMIVYKLENYTSHIYKREVQLNCPTTFAEYLGKGIVEYNIVNMADVHKRESQYSKF
uniref:Integral membrane protein 2 n=1 Tax=Glossina morsitans morsitans TaxID=37546 RepID=A0A1B0FQN8_GLOMM